MRFPPFFTDQFFYNIFDLDPVELILIGNYSYCKHSLEWFCFGGIKIQRITMIPDFTLGLKFVYGLYT